MDGNLEFHSVQLNTLPYSVKTKEIVGLQCWLVGRALRLEISFNAELNCMPCYIGGQERAPSTVASMDSFCCVTIALYTDRSDHHLLPTNLFSSAADGLLVIYFSAELLVEEVRSSPYTYNTIIIATLARVMALKQSLGIDYTQSTVAYIDSPPHSSRQVYYCCWLVAEVAKVR